MIRTRLLKAWRLGVAASSCKQRRIEGLSSTAVLKACHLVTAASSRKQHWIKSSANNALTGTGHSVHADTIPLRSLSTTVNSPEDNHVKWRFPVDKRTEDTIMLVHHGFISMSFSITLNAVTQITDELMEEALNILYNKVESLRICFRLRQNQLWVADMPQRRLDFKSVSGSDVQNQLSELSSSSFDLYNGPLWKARLMTSPADAPCLFPEVKARSPYQYNLLLSLHHAANDGRVMMLLIKLLLSIIDDLLRGLPVDGKEVGELRDGIEVREEENKIKAVLENNPGRLKAALQELDSTKHVPLLVEAFGTINEESPSTHVIPSVIFDKEVMESIDHKCRLLGVSTNACMTAVFNTALVDVVRDAGLKRSNYLISSVHAVDSRRLMGKSTKPYLGYHLMHLTQTTTTPHNVRNHFWSYVKNLDTELSQKLKQNYMCEQRVVNDMLRPQSYNHEAQYAQPMPLCHDYILSNVYSPFASPEGIGSFVHITSISTHVLIHKRSFPVALGLIGVRGQASFEMIHSTATVSREVAGRLLNKIVAVLHDISMALN